VPVYDNARDLPEYKGKLRPEMLKPRVTREMMHSDPEEDRDPGELDRFLAMLQDIKRYGATGKPPE
jgi:hypothetical protein